MINITPLRRHSWPCRTQFSQFQERRIENVDRLARYYFSQIVYHIEPMPFTQFFWCYYWDIMGEWEQLLINFLNAYDSDEDESD